MSSGGGHHGKRRAPRFSPGGYQVFAQALEVSFFDLPQYRRQIGLAPRGDGRIEPGRNRIAPARKPGPRSGPLATTPPLSGLPLGVVAKKGLVKLLPVRAAVDTDKLPQGIFVATLQSERPQHPLDLFQRSAPLCLGLAVERGVECHRDPDRQQTQAQPDPEQLQDHEQDDQDCQGRRRREPFRKPPGGHELAHPEEQRSLPPDPYQHEISNGRPQPQIGEHAGPDQTSGQQAKDRQARSTLRESPATARTAAAPKERR